jgi:hypothetical protein
MLLFGVTIPATAPQRSEIPEGLMNYPVFYKAHGTSHGITNKQQRYSMQLCTINITRDEHKLPKPGEMDKGSR